MNKKVKITKLRQADNALYDTPPIHDYLMGEDNGNVSLPINYWLEGYLTEELIVGKSLTVSRTNRNGVEIGGLFVTSTVTEITSDGFKTLNSVYKLEYI